MKGSYEVCWQIFRCTKTNPSVKIADTNCPCKYDPVNNSQCPTYKPVKIERK